MGFFRSAVTLFFCALSAGCAGWAEMLAGGSDPSPTMTGVSTGLAAVPDVLVQGVSALESGGWAAAAVVTALGLVKAGVTGWRAAGNANKARRLGEIAEGVKKANGGRK